MTRYLFALTFGLLLNVSTALAVESSTEDVTAKTDSGDEVVLHPNGYWEYKDTTKAAVARTKVNQFERDNGCPLGSRPSFLGIGRCIASDDPVFKRGSLGGRGH